MSLRFGKKKWFTNIILVAIIFMFGIVEYFIMSPKQEKPKAIQPPKDAGSVPSSLDENIATITGTVIENNKSCLVDGQCFLKLNTNKGEVDVLYDPGRSTTPHVNLGNVEGVFEIKNGDKVEVHGKSIFSDFISVCDSKDFYIKKLK